MPSAPGRFSTITGLPQRAGSRSATRRAPISAPAPGPNGTMNFTGRCGQLCVEVCADEGVAPNNVAIQASAKARTITVCIAFPTIRSANARDSRPSRQSSGLGFEADVARDAGDLGALLLDHCHELGGGAHAQRLPDAGEALGDGR